MWIFILTLVLGGEVVKSQTWHLPTERRCVEVWKKVNTNLAANVAKLPYNRAPRVFLTKCAKERY